ncbi:hypothetical protein [Saccharothrix sp. HUAS TT1]|uniref:hypothetical protein n=1 Tax=unclassified Saccharothrix TaxID=2593673 RepID=UPI00345C60B3
MSAPAQTAAAEFESRVTAAIDELDRVAGTSPGRRPAHLAQLDVVLRAAVQQARQAEAGSSAVDREADLWRLREPGYLRGIAEHPVDRPSSTLPLLPVVVTWAFLGYAEWSYVTEFAASPSAEPSSFFADWLAQPMWRSPVGLSVIIVVTVVVLMGVYRKPAKAQRRADRIDRIVHRLEVDLLPPLTVLRAGLAPVRVEEHTRQAAVELGAAAKLFTSATVRLAESTTVVDRLVGGVERLVAALPELGAQAEKLDEVRRDLDRTSRLIGAQLEPLASVVSDVSGAAEAAREAVVRSGVVLERADAQLADARSVAERHERHQEALTAAQQPFTAVADVVAEAAGALGRTSALLQKTTDELRATVGEVNWLAMVSDGLRHADEQHDRGTAA